jgi:hypothetical protein
MNPSDRFKKSAKYQAIVSSDLLKRKILFSRKPIREKLIEHLYSFRDEVVMNEKDFQKMMNEAIKIIQKKDGFSAFCILVQRIFITEKNIFKYQFLSFWYEKPVTSVLLIMVSVLLVLNLLLS